MDRVKPIVRYNGVYAVDSHIHEGYPIGSLWVYNEHLYHIMSSAKNAKKYCELYKGGFMIGEDTYGYKNANNYRRLFRNFLNRYIKGEFRYCKSYHGLCKYRYFHELPDLTQRNIKRVADTLNEIYNP